MLHAEGWAQERDSAPAENLLVEPLAIAEREGLAILILLVMSLSNGAITIHP